MDAIGALKCVTGVDEIEVLEDCFIIVEDITNVVDSIHDLRRQGCDVFEHMAFDDELNHYIKFNVGTLNEAVMNLFGPRRYLEYFVRYGDKEAVVNNSPISGEGWTVTVVGQHDPPCLKHFTNPTAAIVAFARLNDKTDSIAEPTFALLTATGKTKVVSETEYNRRRTMRIVLETAFANGGM